MFGKAIHTKALPHTERKIETEQKNEQTINLVVVLPSFAQLSISS